MTSNHHHHRERDDRESAGSGSTMARRPRPAALSPWYVSAAVLATAGAWLLVTGGTPGSAPARTPDRPAAATTNGPTQPETSTGPGPASTSTSPPDRRPSTPTGHPLGDPLAGAVPDALIQQIIDQAGLTNVPPATAHPARHRAWQLLANDLTAGGWRHPRLQASAVTAPGSNTHAPDVVDVTMIWAATDPAGHVAERHRSIVRLAWVDDHWQLDRIT